jgi:homospermidine synthase
MATQLVLIGFGMVSRTMMTMMLKLNPTMARLPIVIIDPKKIVPAGRGRGGRGGNVGHAQQSGGGHGDAGAIPPRPASFNKKKSTQKFAHQPEVIRSEVLGKLMKINPNVTILQQKVTKDNYKSLFETYVLDGAVVVDVAVRVDTVSLIQECQRKKCLYVNTAIDYWVHNDDSLMTVKQHILDNIKYGAHEKRMTAVLNHGMNPGLVSHFTKTLLGILAQRSSDLKLHEWYDKRKYNLIAKKLGLTLIQIAERDNQQTTRPSTEDEFTNTWSVVGLIDEALLKTEVSWGTHESVTPKSASGKKNSQIILPAIGSQVRTRSYEPKGGAFTGYCIPHAEAYSIANFLRVGRGYNPSVYYSYLIPDTAKLISHYLEYALNEDYLPKHEHVLRSDEITSGYDSVGILAFFRTPKGLTKYWVGTIISNDYAKKISPEINGTCLQVAISVLGCIEWMIQNPHKGIIEPEMVDTDFIIDYAHEWLGEFFYDDVTDTCDIESDELSKLLSSPNGILF